MAEMVVKVGQINKITSKEQLVSVLKYQLATRSHQALNGLMRIFANQTAGEQNNGVTVVHNGVGFVPTDATILTSFAQQFQKKGKLSEKQMAILYKRMPKYAGQLIECGIASGKIYKVSGEYCFKRG